MPEPERIVAAIEREGEASTYRAQVSGIGGRVVEAGGLALGPDAEVNLSSGSSTLGQLLLRLFPGSVDLAPEELAFFSDRTQLEIGHHLFHQLFGRLPIAPEDLAELIGREGQELRIVTNDEYLVRLPWVLLAKHETVLAKGKRWSVSLARDGRTADVSMRNLPRVLLAMPEPAGLEKTEREAHEASLRQLVEGLAVPAYDLGRYWQVVRTWPEFHDALRTRDYDLVYFYGHGEGGFAGSRLLFEAGQGQGKLGVTMEQVAQALGESGRSPLQLIYLNCCSGDAGGFLGAGMQLRNHVPAVFTNRTFVRIPMAQQSGKLFFEQIFGKRALPHTAYAALCRSMVLPGDSARSTRPVSWMTPVLHAAYGRWESPRVKAAPSLAEESPPLRFFDRSEPRGALNPLCDRLISVEAAGGFAVLWYGGRRQGVAKFHQHLQHELPAPVHRFRELSWPPELASGDGSYDASRSLLEGLCAALAVATPQGIGQQLRAERIGGSGAHTICYLPVSFPFPGAERLEPGQALQLLLQLLEVFDAEIVPSFEEPFVPVLGLAIEMTDPAAFRACLTPWRGELQLRRLELFPPLPRLREVEDYEVEGYLKYVAPTKRLRIQESVKAAARILEETAGRYDDVVEYLADEERLSSLAREVRLQRTLTG